jgi:hypothetical protein
MIDNIKRTLTILEKALERLARQCYYDRQQYPKIFLEIENYINLIRSWLRDNEIFSSAKAFYVSLSIAFESLRMMISQLWKICKPKTGKKGIKKSRRDREVEKIHQTSTSMMDNISQHIESAKNNVHTIGIALEKGVLRSFDQTIIQKIQNLEDLISKRGGQTYIFPWKDKETYLDFVKDRKRFHIEVLDKLDEYTHHTGHEPDCSGPKEYHLDGFRKNPRKTIMNGGEQETYPIRMIRCKKCKKRFSLVPSFLPREKNFGIEIIGNVYRNMFRFNLSIQGAIENLKIIGKRSVKSKQTILNWTQWVGSLHPATILTRAGLNGSAYLQEDEGFEREPNLRTYCVVMVDPENQLVWHTDYLDHVDEKQLCGSFENFLQKIDFKILGVTKDKWKASTNALKSVFHRIWIGYCHRHCLKHFRDALSKYQDQSKCSDKEVSRLYKKFKKVLKTSTSKINLEARIKSLNDEAFSAPILQERLEELKENAAHYTAHKNRKGITQTTSIVDNYLKGIKRKLRQIESFRDNKWAKLSFLAHANIRNFVPFLPGSKNAHQSPFELAGGQTYGLPWIQTMSVHNAFLFTENAL